jgi:putative spermidine/putrescine transport system permease protein
MAMTIKIDSERRFPTRASGTPRLVRGRLAKLRYWRAGVLVAAGVYFLVPLYAGIRFSLTDVAGNASLSAVRQLPSEPGLGAAFFLSLRLMILATTITLVLVVPTAIYVATRKPGLARILDAITILPIVIPPVVLIIGVLKVAPTLLKGTPYLLGLEYAVLATPLAYRSLSGGLAALDVVTLVEASRSLGAGWWSTLRHVMIPNLRSAILSATFLTVALVFGEYTMASLDEYQTFSVWIVNFDDQNAHVSVAASMLALLVTWLVLVVIAFIDRRSGRSAIGMTGVL